MIFQIQQVSDVGTQNPIVARLQVGMLEIIKMAQIDYEKEKQVTESCFRIAKFLIQAEKFALPLMDEIRRIESQLATEGVQTQSSGRVINTPPVLLLDNSRVFFKYAKQALQELAKALGLLLDKEFNGPHFHKILEHAVEELGNEHLVTKLLQEDQGWLKEINDIRNEDEHPKSGKLFTRGYNIVKLENERFLITPPVFFNDSPILNRLEVFSHNLLTFTEEILAHTLEGFFPNIFVVYTIPEEQRKFECPVRYRLGLKDGIILGKEGEK